MNSFYILPFNIIRKIYEYDSTYHTIHKNVLTEIIWYSHFTYKPKNHKITIDRTFFNLSLINLCIKHVPKLYKKSKTFTSNYLSCISYPHYLCYYLLHTQAAPKLLLMDITPQMIQCALIRTKYEYKIVKKYNVYIKAKLNVTVSRKAYISNYKEAFRIELL